MHPELEKLIEMVIADGQVTDKERAVLIKKAISLDVDPDEVEIYLDGRLHQFTTATVASQPVAKSNKEGEIKKCPSCGATLDSFQTKCSDCGHELREIEVSKNIKQFLIELEKLLTEKPTGIFSGGYKLVQYYDRVASFIINYTVPNSKEDILEFLGLALNNLAKQKSTNPLSMFISAVDSIHEKKVKDAWSGKATQVIMKARFSMKDDHKTLDMIEYYAKQLKIK